jgi:hypothetical protein
MEPLNILSEVRCKIRGDVLTLPYKIEGVQGYLVWPMDYGLVVKDPRSTLRTVYPWHVVEYYSYNEEA